MGLLSTTTSEQKHARPFVTVFIVIPLAVIVIVGGLLLLTGNL